VYKYLFILCTVLALPAFAKTDSLVLIKSIPIQATTFTTDKTGNCYAASSNTIMRYNSNGDSTGYFNTIRNGEPTYIDASNPLRVLLLYADYPKLIVLDRVLNEKNSLNLKQLQLYNVPAAAYSADGLIWIYNGVSMELSKLDEDNVKLQVSQQFMQLFQENILPTFMVEQDRNLFVIDSTKGIYRFDQFGTYLMHYPFLINKLQYFNKQLVYYKNGALINYDTQKLTEQIINIPEPLTVQDARVERNRIYVLRKNSVDIYVLPTP
jgi:hypothetical protein